MSGLKGFTVALAVVSCIGCEHPTAPQARDAIDKTEKNMLSGDVGSLQNGMQTLIDMASYYGYSNNPYVPRSTMTIVRDGEAIEMGATVVERVYLPAPGSGGRPFIRRSVVAWAPDALGHPDRVRFLVLMSNDSVSTLAVPSAQATDEGSVTRRYGQLGFALNVDAGDRRTWYSTGGTLNISTSDPIGPCPYTGQYAADATGIAEVQQAKTAGLVCDLRMYTVSSSMTLMRGDPNNRHPLDNLMPPTGTLQTSLQQIRGVRFVTQCKGKVPIAEEPLACYDYLSFWRDGSQFAPELGVDLSAARAWTPQTTW